MEPPPQPELIMTTLTSPLPCLFLSADRRRVIEEQVLPAGTQIRRESVCPVTGERSFQARSAKGEPWYNYRA